MGGALNFEKLNIFPWFSDYEVLFQEWTNLVAYQITFDIE